MTFASQVKNEIAKSNISKKCCAVSELYGILLVANVFSHTFIKIVTENKEIAKRIPILFKKGFNINVNTHVKNNKFIFEIDNPMEIEKIFSELSYDYKYHINFNLNRGIVDDICCTASFFKGLFLGCAMVASPEKKSHLEFSTSHAKLSREIMALMLDCDMKPKEIVRKNMYVIYFKDTTLVEDFLTMIGATNSAMKIMEAKVQKELINNVNRRVNCETANLAKAIDTSVSQSKIIKKAIDNRGIDIFSENLHETINLRINNLGKSLSELGEMHNPSITKSAINHRMRKIMQIAKENI